VIGTSPSALHALLEDLSVKCRDPHPGKLNLCVLRVSVVRFYRKVPARITAGKL
jgi:hypothetical protein